VKALKNLLGVAFPKKPEDSIQALRGKPSIILGIILIIRGNTNYQETS